MEPLGETGEGTFWTSLTVNGLYNVALESIIRRYELSYTFMSTVPATYGLTQVSHRL